MCPRLSIAVWSCHTLSLLFLLVSYRCSQAWSPLFKSFISYKLFSSYDIFCDRLINKPFPAAFRRVDSEFNFSMNHSELRVSLWDILLLMLSFTVSILLQLPVNSPSFQFQLAQCATQFHLPNTFISPRQFSCIKVVFSNDGSSKAAIKVKISRQKYSRLK